MVELVRAELTIRTDGDVLRRERLARSLYTEPRTVEDIDVRFGDPAGEAEAKGAGTLVRQSPMASWPGRSRVAGVHVCGTSGIVPGGGVAIRASGRRGRVVSAG